VDDDKSTRFTREIRSGLSMILRAVDEAADSNTVMKAALRDVIPSFGAEYQRHYVVGKTGVMETNMDRALAQAGLLDKMVRLFESIRDKRR
jgi:hypothetical protein